jgi:hypothetical protein
MDFGTFWESVGALRRLELITLLVTMVFPVLSGTLLLGIRHRLKTIQARSSQTQGAFFEDNVERLRSKNKTLTEELSRATREVETLRRQTAPRQITPLQEDILLEKLRGVQAAPVMVAAYAFEEESATYAAEIAAVLRKAHWDVTLNKASMNDFKGVSLGKIDLMHQPVPGLHELAQAFTEARIDLRPHEIRPDTIAGALQDGSLLVVVGRR